MPCAVLLIIFNRPSLTARTFAAIRMARPPRLFIHADGARAGQPGEADLCEQARQATADVDWPCEVHRLYRDTNMGCGPGVSSAISWFLNDAEEGAILEDDCVPHIAFFGFVDTMLERYRSDDRVMHICGTGFQTGATPSRHTVTLLPFPMIWGWATWRRAWAHYRFELPSESEIAAIVRRENHTASERAYWTQTFNATRTRRINTWDYQWVFTLWRLRGLAVAPSLSLVSNDGYGPDATHPDGLVPDCLSPLITHSDDCQGKWDPPSSPSIINMDQINRRLLKIEPSNWNFRLQELARQNPWSWRLYLTLRRRIRPILCRHSM